MSTLTQPRGPLPPRVYWRRRMALAAMALVLALALGYALNLGSNGSSASDQGRQVAASPTSQADGSDRTERDRPPTSPSRTRRASPDGGCRRSEISVAPEIRDAVGGKSVRIQLMIEADRAACTWTFSAKTAALRITSGDEEIWSSRECPAVMKREKLVLRRDDAVPVQVEWNGKRSDAGCTNRPDWASLGWYYASAAALGGEPERVHFELVRPDPEVITKSPKPRRPQTGRESGDDRSTPTDEPTGSPTGAVEPSA
jgi:hypothetical protein